MTRFYPNSRDTTEEYLEIRYEIPEPKIATFVVSILASASIPVMIGAVAFFVIPTTEQQRPKIRQLLLGVFIILEIIFMGILIYYSRLVSKDTRQKLLSSFVAPVITVITTLGVWFIKKEPSQYQQNLDTVADKIRDFLNDTSKTLPTGTDEEKLKAVLEVCKVIKGDQQLMEMINNTLQAGDKSTLEQKIDHPLAGILVSFLVTEMR